MFSQPNLLCVIQTYILLNQKMPRQLMRILQRLLFCMTKWRILLQPTNSQTEMSVEQKGKTSGVAGYLSVGENVLIPPMQIYSYTIYNSIVRF